MTSKKTDVEKPHVNTELPADLDNMTSVIVYREPITEGTVQSEKTDVEEPPVEEGPVRSVNGHVNTELPADLDNITSMIVYRERITEGTVQSEKVHGPMPVSEWPAYAAENGL